MKSVLLMLGLVVSASLFADSPLTSTNFAQFYVSNEMVKHVKEKGLDEVIMAFLASKEGDPVIKIAVINELGWGNKTVVKRFEDYLVSHVKGLRASVFNELRVARDGDIKDSKMTKKLSSDMLLSWAYLQAMSDYFNPKFADRAATLAFQREKGNSMAHATVLALIRCQIAFDTSWCEVYKIGHEMFEEVKYPKNNISETAVTHIMEYLVLYQGDC